MLGTGGRDVLKRYQILLNDWQANHYKLISEKYDVSFSEIIRMALCIDIIKATQLAFPNHKFEIDYKLLENAIKKHNIIDVVGREDFHVFLSKLYFETRKATELWKKYSNNNNNKKKKK